MIYNLDYLEEKYEIFYDKEYDLYNMGVYWINSDEAEEFTFTTGEPKEGFKNAIPNLNDLSKLEVENSDTIVVALNNHIEYLARFQIWNYDNYKKDIFLIYNKFDIDNVEEVAELVAAWFYIKGYKNITIELRMWYTEEDVERFVDYCLNN